MPETVQELIDKLTKFCKDENISLDTELEMLDNHEWVFNDIDLNFEDDTVYIKLEVVD
jgi:hypothetical protein